MVKGSGNWNGDWERVTVPISDILFLISLAHH